MATELNTAIRALRVALGESQEHFARRMGTALRTVARWETVNRAPSGVALTELKRLAVLQGREDLKAVFNAALMDAGLAWDTSGFEMALEPVNDDERLVVAGLLAVLRSPIYAKLRAKIIALLRVPMQRCVDMMAGVKAMKDLKTIDAEVNRLMNAGVEPATVAKLMNLSEKDLHLYGVVQRMQQSLERVKNTKGKGTAGAR